MASRLYLLVVVVMCGYLSIVGQPNMPFVTAQAQTTERKAEADRLLKQGNQQFSVSQFESAIQSLQQALQIYREVGNRQGESYALGNLGITYKALGKYDRAIEYELQLLAIAREIRDRQGEGAALANLGVTYQDLGKYDKAIEYHEQALTIAKEIADRPSVGRALGNLGVAYEQLGKYNKAIEYHEQALTIAREIKDRASEGKALGNLGIAYEGLGKHETAIDFQRQLLAIARDIKLREQNAGVVSNSGTASENLGKYDKYDKAIEYELQWLAIAREIKDGQSEGYALNRLGNTYSKRGRDREAMISFQQAIAIANEIGDRSNAGYALANIAGELVKQKQNELAIIFYKQSVNVRESIRKDTSRLDKDIQQSYLDTISASYHSLADLLLQQGRVTEALQVLDLLKIQELDDYLKNVKGSDRTVKGIEFLETERAISSQLSGVSFEKIPELNSQLKNQIQQLPKTELNKVPNYLQKLPKGAVLIYPLILSDRLEIVVFSANTLPINRTVPIKRAALEKLVADYRSDLQDFSSIDVKDSSKKLYDVLIQPIEADLIQANATTILYAPDGLLRYIPLAALYDGKQWLVEKYRVNNLIAYSLFDPDSKAQVNLRIFAGAYGGKGGETRFGLSGLPSTIPEVDNIQSVFQNTTKLIGQDFTASLSKSKVSGNTIIHFATHAEFKSGSPLDSYVLFGDGSKVTLAEINEWNLKDVGLVVLSACQTGVGSLGNGAEILGFGYQVHRAGAKASIASLWTVSDGGTQLLMAAFYGNLHNGNISMSTSLREAQLSMIRRPTKQGKINYNHPYYWSAFVLIGNGL